MKYAVMVVLDLDIKILDSTKAEEVEKITGNVVRMQLEGEHGVRIKMMRTKLLGLVEKLPAREEKDYLPDLLEYIKKDRLPGHPE